MCNLLCIMSSSGFYPLDKIPHRPADFKDGPAAKLYTVANPASYSNLLFPGTYVLEIEMSAQNVPLTRHRFRIRLEEWHEDFDSMFSDHGVTVEPLRPDEFRAWGKKLSQQDAPF